MADPASNPGQGESPAGRFADIDGWLRTTPADGRDEIKGEPIARCQELCDLYTLGIKRLLDCCDSYADWKNFELAAYGQAGTTEEDGRIDWLYVVVNDTGEVAQMVWPEFYEMEHAGRVRKASLFETQKAKAARATQSTEATNPLLPPCPALA